MVYPTTHNDLAASEVGPLSNWDRPCMENEGWGDEGKIYNLEEEGTEKMSQLRAGE